jgi:large subunit ribosomal protein L5
VKINVNRGVGEGSKNSKELNNSLAEMVAILGQKPLIAKATKSIAGFKIRSGVGVGAFATLRSKKLYTFFLKLIHLVLPRMDDFRGIKLNGFDGHGNYNFGLQEQLIFPEIFYDLIIKTKGFDISIVTTAKTDGEAFALLSFFGMPFETN